MSSLTQHLLFQYSTKIQKFQVLMKGSDTLFYTLILENETGQQIDLSKTANRFMFSKIEGLNPPAGTISTSSYAGMDGSYLNNAFIEKRNVVIPFEMRGFDVELRRHELYMLTSIISGISISIFDCFSIMNLF